MTRWLPLLLCLLLGPCAAASAAMNAQRETLPNGMVLVTSEQPALPIVSVRLLIRAGSRYDPGSRHGLANLTSRLLTRGTPTHDAMGISGLVEGMGAHFWADSGRELATLNLNILKKDLDTGLALLGEVVTAASFRENEVSRVKQSLAASIRAKRGPPQFHRPGTRSGPRSSRTASTDVRWKAPRTRSAAWTGTPSSRSTGATTAPTGRFWWPWATSPTRKSSRSSRKPWRAGIRATANPMNRWCCRRRTARG